MNTDQFKAAIEEEAKELYPYVNEWGISKTVVNAQRAAHVKACLKMVGMIEEAWDAGFNRSRYKYTLGAIDGEGTTTPPPRKSEYIANLFKKQI